MIRRHLVPMDSFSTSASDRTSYKPVSLPAEPWHTDQTREHKPPREPSVYLRMSRFGCSEVKVW